MKSGKKLILCLAQSFFCLVIVSLAACSGELNLFQGSNSQSIVDLKAPASEQVYRTPQVGFVTFDPALAGDSSSWQAIEMVFTGLVSLNDQYTAQPQLAQTWSLGSDGVTWTFHLRHNLKFSDGTPLTAQDVAYSIDRALQPSTGSTYSQRYLSLIKDADLLHAGRRATLIGDSIFTPDNNTIDITTNKRAPYFLNSLTVPTSFVVEKKLISEYGSHWTDHLNEGGGAGPFIVKQFNPTHGIDFVPNPNYYGPMPQLQKVTFAFYMDYENSYRGYQIGQLDTTPIPLDEKDLEAAANTAEYHQAPQLTIDYVGMNYLTKPFDDIHIRQAFALALNKEEIASKLWLNTQIPTYHIIPQGMPAYNINLTGPAGVTDPAGNSALAKALLQQGLREEGWSSVSQLPSIKLTYFGYPGDPKMDTVIGMWKSVLGIRVEANPISDTPTFYNELDSTVNNSHGLQLWVSGWSASYTDPQPLTTQVFDKDSPDNFVNYGQNNSSDAAQQQAVQREMEAADTDFDQKTRIAMYQQAEQALVNDVAWIPFLQATNTFLLRTYVHGIVTTNPTVQTPVDDWANIYITAH